MEANRKIQRIPHEGAVAGVCAGLGEYFGVDKTWVRVGFIFTIFFAGSGIGFVGPLLYIILWVVLPVKPIVLPSDAFNVDYRTTRPNVPPVTADDGHYASSYGGAYGQQQPKAKKSTRKSKSDQTTAGIILLGIGVFFLLHQFDVFYWRQMVDYWPVLLIFMGLVNIVMAFAGRGSATDIPPVVSTDEAVPTPADTSEIQSDTSREARQGETSHGADEPKN